MRALIVDDDSFSLDLLQDVLQQLGHEVEQAANGAQALALLRKGGINLVITDWEMPEMNGLELCQTVRKSDFDSYVYIIMLTSRDSGQHKIEGLHAGADAFLSKPLNPDELLVSLKTAERILALETRDLAIFALAKLSESRDTDTGAHIERVQSYARLMAQFLSTTEKYHDVIDTEFVRLIFQTSPLHDIGKVGIPDYVLLKPGKLTDQEMDIMRTHAALGAQTLEASLQRFPGVPFLQMARDIALYHHERWDGKGYPAGLSGTDIPLAARVVALADVYDAVTSCRIYREAMTHAQAKALIVRERGTHFDPDVVDAFLKIEARFISIKEEFKDAAAAVAVPQLAAAAAQQQWKTTDQVMVVDDDVNVRDFLSNLLNHLGIDCIACADGSSALAEFDQHCPRLIISDWEMPGMDGLELCRCVRARNPNIHVHFIMLTIHSAEEQLEKAFSAGIDDFMPKPFTKADLMTRLRVGKRALALHDELRHQNHGSQQLNEKLIGLNDRLQTLAITDDLTGLYNRRHAMHRLEEHWALCDRYQRPIAVIALDIDHFKRVNDSLGHSAGDAVLKGIAQVLRRCVRSTDIVCRVGGEEFLVILPSQTLHEADMCAQRCRQEVNAYALDWEGKSVRVTISAGIAVRRPGMQQIAELLADADAALYVAKNSGRNIVCKAPNLIDVNPAA